MNTRSLLPGACSNPIFHGVKFNCFLLRGENPNMFDTNMVSHHCLPSQKIALETPSEINQPFLLQDELQNQSQGPPAHRLRCPKDPPKCAFQVPRLKRPMITLRGPGPAKALPGKHPEKTGGNAIHLSTP